MLVGEDGDLAHGQNVSRLQDQGEEVLHFPTTLRKGLTEARLGRCPAGEKNRSGPRPLLIPWAGECACEALIILYHLGAVCPAAAAPHSE